MCFVCVGVLVCVGVCVVFSLCNCFVTVGVVFV